MKRCILSLLFSILLPLYTLAQPSTNKVFWVHGLNDNRSSDETSQVWYVFKTSLTEPANQGTSIQWSGNKSISVAGNALISTVNREVPSGKAIVFGHSAGGLVARYAAQNGSGKIRAIITAGTPNNGAGIVTSLQDGSFNNVADKVIAKLNVSLAAGSFAIASVVHGLARPILVLLGATPALLNNTEQAFAKDFIDEQKESFYKEIAVQDMDPDLTKNPFLEILNTTAPTVPIINLYGNESGKRLIRMAGTVMHRDEVNSYLNTTQATYDDKAMPIYNLIQASCATFQVTHAALGVSLGVLAVYYPKYWVSSALNVAAAVSWTDTQRFVQYDCHNEWDKIIGATHIEKEEEWHKLLWKKWLTVKYVTVYDPSDGFIPNNSSMMETKKGATIQNIEVPGVNHLEMNSHPEMKRYLEDILKNSRYGDVFNPKK